MTRAIAIVHQSGRNLPRQERRRLGASQAWCVRNWKDHPFDPGWEDGRYCACHKKFRNANTRTKGEIVVDCVNDGTATRVGYPVRSYFEISDVQRCRFGNGRDLVFLSYHFSDGEPYRLRRKIGALGTKLTEEEFAELTSHPSYQVYNVSANRGPVSISKENWINMVDAKKAGTGASYLKACKIKHQCVPRLHN